MPANFNWQAEDERSWDEFKTPNKPEPPKRRVGLRLVLAGIVVLILVTAGYFVFRQMQGLIAQTESAAEVDILTSQDLVLQAVNTGDPEVLVSVLSGREQEWTDTIVSLLDKDLLYNRAQLGLEWDRTVPPSDIDVSISPDIHEAEVRFSLTYSQSLGLYGAVDQDSRIQLQQTAVFRTSQDRWLLAPPLDEFWGNRITSEGRYITVSYPDRDTEIGQRMAADLEAALGSACSKLAGVDCSESDQLRVVLSADPSVLLDLAASSSQFDDSNEVLLPTPTLMGLPANNEAYEALERAYAARVIRRMLNHLSDWECCEQALFYEALIAYQLAQLGFQDWPATPQDYVDVLREPASFDRVSELWENSQPIESASKDPDSWLAYALVEFLFAERMGLSAAAMMDLLSTTGNFFEWYHQIIQMDYTTEYVERAWNEFLLQRIDVWQVESPVPFPNQDIAMICDEGIVGSANLYVYDPIQDSWLLSLTNREIVHMSAVPGGNGVMFSEQLFRPERVQTFVWSDERESIVDEGHRVFRLTGRADPQGQYAGLSGYDRETFSGGHYVLDINGCESGVCSYEPVSGGLRWSPSGERTLFIDASLNQTIHVGDVKGNISQLAGEGRDPFWISDVEYGYIRSQGIPTIVSSTIDFDDTQNLFHRLDVAELITGTNEADIVILRAATQPSTPKKLIVTAGNRAGNQTYIVAYDWITEESTLIYESDVVASALTTVRFSPNGRWLLIMSAVPNSSAALPRFDVTLYDLEKNEMQQLLPADGVISPSLGWSADSKWLLHLSDGKLILTAPEEKYQHLVLHGLNACRGAAWTNTQ